MFPSATNKFLSLVMNGLADVDGFKLCIQVCVWLGFPPLIKVETLIYGHSTPLLGVINLDEDSYTLHHSVVMVIKWYFRKFKNRHTD